jgi:hypothetical protein
MRHIGEERNNTNNHEFKVSRLYRGIASIHGRIRESWPHSEDILHSSIFPLR